MEARVTGEAQRSPELAQGDHFDEESVIFAAIVDSSNDAIIGETLDGGIIAWNRAAEKIFGYRKDEVLGRNVSLLAPPGGVDDASEILEKIRKGEQVKNFEAIRMSKDSRRIQVSLTISPVRDHGGKVVGASTIARDVSGRRKKDEEMLRLAASVKSSDDAIVGLDLDGVITSWNQGAEKIFGFSRDDVIGKSVSILSPSKKLDELPEIIRKIARGEAVEHYEARRNKKSGAVFDVSITITPIKDDVGEVIGYSKIIRDISGLKRGAAYARSLIEASIDPLVTISPAGKITDVNGATIQATGVSREGLIGSDFSSYFTQPEKAREAYRQVLLKEKVTDYPLTIRHVSGKTTDVFYNASVYKDDAGKVLGVFAAAHDITAQKQASVYARSLIEASLDPLVTISAEGKITDVNEATVKATGDSREKLIGSDFSNYFTDSEEARQGYLQVFKEGFVTDYPLTLRHVSGQVTDVLYNASVYKDEKGNVIGAFATARNVTERKKMEDQLHATSAYARSLLEASLDPMVTISLEGKITDVNRATETITGVSREWLIGTDFSNYFTEPSKAREAYRLAFKLGFVRDYPLAMRHASGRVAEVLYNATVYKDAFGHIRGVFAAARDVTESKKAAQYARSLIEASLDSLVMISAEGKITDVNEATVSVTGVPRHELIGTDFSSYFTEPEKARQCYQKVFKEGFVTDYPLTIRSKEQKLTEVLYNASVYKDARGNVTGVFAAARDYSEVKHATRQLEETNKELEAFSYSISHDLRAPLRTIDSFAKIFDDDYSQTLDDEGRRLIGVIRGSARQMGKLIDDILAFARLGREKMNAQPTDMTLLAKTVYDEVALLNPSRKIDFRLNELPPARVDPPLFRQVWYNLISNAVKFTKHEAAPQIEIGDTIEDDHVVYWVKDNGCGFDMKYVDKLFGAFERLHDQQEFEGTGVGLAVVKQIVKRHGGKVWAEAKVDGGATFYFSLPSEKAAKDNEAVN
jgi:PAS domain S-box-containing protein